ncbi:hypothetical protein [Paracoccus alkenifer]|nr:hypothetical protein [Paracoccus alkenifer]
MNGLLEQQRSLHILLSSYTAQETFMDPEPAVVSDRVGGQIPHAPSSQEL